MSIASAFSATVLFSDENTAATASGGALSARSNEMTTASRPAAEGVLEAVREDEAVGRAEPDAEPDREAVAESVADRDGKDGRAEMDAVADGDDESEGEAVDDEDGSDDGVVETVSLGSDDALTDGELVAVCEIVASGLADDDWLELRDADAVMLGTDADGDADRDTLGLADPEPLVDSVAVAVRDALPLGDTVPRPVGTVEVLGVPDADGLDDGDALPLRDPVAVKLGQDADAEALELGVKEPVCEAEELALGEMVALPEADRDAVCVDETEALDDGEELALSEEVAVKLGQEAVAEGV